MMNLVFEKSYLSDQGIHAGQQYVQLHGYLTQAQLGKLEELIRNGETARSTVGFDIQVLDQDDQQVTLLDAHRGHGAVVVQVEIDKPPALLSTEDARIVLAAALLGMNLSRDVRAIGADIENELSRMGYALTTKEVKHT
jgi:hypothetical protein